MAASERSCVKLQRTREPGVECKGIWDLHGFVSSFVISYGDKTTTMLIRSQLLRVH